MPDIVRPAEKHEEQVSGELVGSPIRRREDPRLLTGQAAFVADIQREGMLEVAILRSPRAHALIRSVDLTRAAGMPGVRLVLCDTDLEKDLGPMPIGGNAPGQRNAVIHPLAVGRVLHVGQALAAVVAESRYAAEDALEAIRIEYGPLPAIVDPELALGDEAPRLHPDWGDNVAARRTLGGGDLEAVFEAADLVIEERLEIQRHTAASIETRGVAADFDAATGALTYWSSTQYPHANRSVLAEALGMPEPLIRCIAPEVGGAFGMKAHFYMEDLLIPYLARRLGQPVRWIEDRQEHFLSAVHAREQIHQVRVAIKNDGTILGLHDRLLANAGAYLHWVGAAPVMVTAMLLPNVYRLKAYRCDVTVVVTNKVPSGAYRGFGTPQAAFVIERIVDLVAHKLGMDPAEVRRRNTIAASELPYTNLTNLHYDSGDYPETLSRTLEMIGYDGFRQEQAAGRERGRYLGIGLAATVEPTAPPTLIRALSGARTGGWEQAIVRVEPTGTVTVLNGTAPNGQGHHTIFAQVAAQELGVPISSVKVVTGDTATTPFTPLGASSSRTAAITCTVIAMAAKEARGQLLRAAAKLFEAPAEDIDLSAGELWVRGSADRRLTVQQVARYAWMGHNLAEGDKPGIEAHAVYEAPDFTFANAVHAATVEVDPETGQVTVLRYVIVHDCGTVLNPLLLAGQVMGGVAQATGGAFLEELKYDDGGQLLTGSFVDYMCPTAAELFDVEMGHLVTPTPLRASGVKGAAEGGTLGPAPVFANAISDALRPYGVEMNRSPFTPEAVLSALRAGRTGVS